MNEQDEQEQLRLLRKLADRKFINGYSYDAKPPLPRTERWMVFLAVMLIPITLFLFVLFD